MILVIAESLENLFDSDTVGNYDHHHNHHVHHRHHFADDPLYDVNDYFNSQYHHDLHNRHPFYDSDNYYHNPLHPYLDHDYHHYGHPMGWDGAASPYIPPRRPYFYDHPYNNPYNSYYGPSRYRYYGGGRRPLDYANTYNMRVPQVYYGKYDLYHRALANDHRHYGSYAYDSLGHPLYGGKLRRHSNTFFN